MQPIFEKDIPQLRGKNWGDRQELKAKARALDRRSSFRSFGHILIFMPILCVLMELRKAEIIPSLLLVVVIYFLLSWPCLSVYNAFFINPLIKTALEKHAEDAVAA